MNLFSEAMAQATETAAAQPSAFQSLMPFFLIFVIFYFLLIRPQKKKMQKEENFLTTLQKGQEVYTKSGILGKISGLTDKVATLEISQGNSMKVLKSQIAGLSAPLFEKPKPKATGKPQLSKN